jgi:hypothetical protein
MSSLTPDFPWTSFAISWPSPQDEYELKTRQRSGDLLLSQLLKDKNADESTVPLPDDDETGYGTQSTVVSKRRNQEEVVLPTEDSYNIMESLLVGHEFNLEEIERMIHLCPLKASNEEVDQANGFSKHFIFINAFLADVSFPGIHSGYNNKSMDIKDITPSSPSLAYSQWSSVSSARQPSESFKAWCQFWPNHRKTTDVLRPAGADPVPQDNILFFRKRPVRRINIKSRLRSLSSSCGLWLKKNDSNRPIGAGNQYLNEFYWPTLQLGRARTVKKAKHGQRSKRPDLTSDRSGNKTTSSNSQTSWGTISRENSVQLVTVVHKRSTRQLPAQLATPYLQHKGLLPKRRILPPPFKPDDCTESGTSSAVVPSSVSPVPTHYLVESLSTPPSPLASYPRVAVVDDKFRRQPLLLPPRPTVSSRLQYRLRKQAASSQLRPATVVQKSTREPRPLAPPLATSNQQGNRCGEKAVKFPVSPPLKIQVPVPGHTQEPLARTPDLGANTRQKDTFQKQGASSQALLRPAIRAHEWQPSPLPALPTAGGLQKHQLRRYGAIWNSKLADISLTAERIGALSKQPISPRAPIARAVGAEADEAHGENVLFNDNSIHDDENEVNEVSNDELDEVFIGIAEKVAIHASLHRPPPPIYLTSQIEQELDTPSTLNIPSPVFPRLERCAHHSSEQELDVDDEEEDDDEDEDDEDEEKIGEEIENHLTHFIQTNSAELRLHAQIYNHRCRLPSLPDLDDSVSEYSGIPNPLRSEKHPNRLPEAPWIPPLRSEKHPSRLSRDTNFLSRDANLFRNENRRFRNSSLESFQSFTYGDDLAHTFRGPMPKPMEVEGEDRRSRRKKRNSMAKWIERLKNKGHYLLWRRADSLLWRLRRQFEGGY